MESVISEMENLGSATVFRSMLRAAESSIGLQSERLDISTLVGERGPYYRSRNTNQIIGEIFKSENALYILTPQGKRLALWEVRHHSIESKIDEVCNNVTLCVQKKLDGRRVRGMEFEWGEAALKLLQGRRAAYRPSYFSERPLKSKSPAYTADELEQARVITDSAAREFLLSLAQVGKARSKDTSSIANETLTQRLVETDLIQKEYLITCRKDSRTICTVNDASYLESSSGAGMSCPTCGRALKDELIQEIFSLTSASRELLSSSHWMTIWLTEVLQDAGLDSGQIGWNPETEDEELDVVANILGERMVFELKDREFGLGDAYPFGFRIERYGASVGVVATTEHVSNDAKRFFEETKGRVGERIHFLEGIENIQNDMMLLLHEWSKNAIERIFDDYSYFVGLDIGAFIQSWMKESEVAQ